MINNKVPIDTVRQMLDHASPEMTARYATIKHQTLRREFDQYQQRINVRGEVIHLDLAGPGIRRADRLRRPAVWLPPDE
jgi:hypothetical protein